MNVTFADISLARQGTLAVLVTEGASLRGVAADLDAKLGGALKRAMKAANFSGKSGTVRLTQLIRRARCGARGE